MPARIKNKHSAAISTANVKDLLLAPVPFSGISDADVWGRFDPYEIETVTADYHRPGHTTVVAKRLSGLGGLATIVLPHNAEVWLGR